MQKPFHSLGLWEAQSFSSASGISLFLSSPLISQEAGKQGGCRGEGKKQVPYCLALDLQQIGKGSKPCRWRTGESHLEARGWPKQDAPHRTWAAALLLEVINHRHLTCHALIKEQWLAQVHRVPRAAWCPFYLCALPDPLSSPFRKQKGDAHWCHSQVRLRLDRREHFF